MENSSFKQPTTKPNNPKFSTGPASKFLGYNINDLDLSILGRSHRSVESSKMLQEVVVKTKALLSIPQDYKVILTPGSDTGAMEIALWNLIGLKPIDLLSWEHFGYMWEEDLSHQLKISNLSIFNAPFGELPDLSKVDFKNNDVIFTYCGTTSGVVFNKTNLIPEQREGLIIADATSYVFSEDINWKKIDVLTLSWQKCLGGEAQTGMLVLSPKAIDRINCYTPTWPIPHLFRLKKNNSIDSSLLDTGSPINTLSMLGVADFLYALNWCLKNGGIEFTKNKINKNFNVLNSWVSASNWIEFLARDPSTVSKVSVCLKIKHPTFLKLAKAEKIAFINNINKYLSTNNIAFDINSYSTAPLGFRIWTGTTVESNDLLLLTKWLDFCFWQELSKL